jgi:hypothetical protein
MTQLFVMTLCAIAAFTGSASAQSADTVITPVASSITIPTSTLPSSSTSITNAAPQPSITHSSQYYYALAVHRDISYAMIPLFGVQYAMGRRLIKGGAPTWVRTTHIVGFHVLGAMAVVNTATGIVNVIATRKEKPDRLRRIIHTSLMLAGDAGFAYTASIAHDAAKQGPAEKRRHERAATVSMSLTTAGAVVMWLR